MAARPASGLGKRSNVAPSIATIVSPASRPAASAGEPACTSANVRPPCGVASQAIPKKMTKARRRFMPTPATQDDELLPEALHRERARIVGVAVLALEADEAADRQPVQGVERLALRAQDLRPRREADAELQDADPEEAGQDEVAHLVDDARGRRG